MHEDGKSICDLQRGLPRSGIFRWSEDLRLLLVCPGGGSCPCTEQRMSWWSLRTTCFFFLLRSGQSGLVFNVKL